jgi:hypothetical protein
MHTRQPTLNVDCYKGGRDARQSTLNVDCSYRASLKAEFEMDL